MSYTKDRKIRKLKQKRLWPRILTMVLIDIFILCFTCLLSYFAVIGVAGTNFLKNTAENEKIVDAINKKWNEKNVSDGIELDLELKSIQKIISDSVQGIYITNSDFQILKAYGNPDVSFEEIFNIRKARRQLEKGDVYTKISSMENDIDNDEDFDLGFEKNALQVFHEFINFRESTRHIDIARKLNEKIFAKDYWFVYPCELPGIYVCINDAYIVNNFQAYYFLLLLMIFGVVFVVSLIYHVVELFVYVAEAVKFDLLISTDWVTGGKNRYWFNEKARRKIRMGRKQYVVVQIRLEKYHNYCMTYGVKQSENLLEVINNVLENLVNKNECVAHLEKSDFALFLSYESKVQLDIRVRKILKRLTVVRENQHLTFIAGIADVSSKSSDINSLLSASGLALVEAEVSSVDLIWFNDSMKDEQVWERRIEDDMEKALENHEFKVYLQAKYSTKGECLAAAEALVRWIHPELGFISPGKFIPIFEKNGFILKLDDYMLTEVAKLQAKWMGEGKKLVPISVNISRAHFTKEDLAEHICKIVDQCKVPHQFIELELTESAFFDDKSVLLETVKKLKKFGFAVSMDDFGAGYSSLNSLKELPLDVIKLDADFFRGQVDDLNRANLIVSDTISLAKKLGMQIVAEGIETREQVDFLAKHDCDLIQGFYFAKPVPVEEFEEKAYPKNDVKTM